MAVLTHSSVMSQHTLSRETLFIQVSTRVVEIWGSFSKNDIHVLRKLGQQRVNFIVVIVIHWRLAHPFDYPSKLYIHLRTIQLKNGSEKSKQ